MLPPYDEMLLPLEPVLQSRAILGESPFNFPVTTNARTTHTECKPLDATLDPCKTAGPGCGALWLPLDIGGQTRPIRRQDGDDRIHDNTLVVHRPHMSNFHSCEVLQVQNKFTKHHTMSQYTIVLGAVFKFSIVHLAVS